MRKADASWTARGKRAEDAATRRRRRMTAGGNSGLPADASQSVFDGDAVALRGDPSRRGVVERVAALSDSEDDDYSDEEHEVRVLAAGGSPRIRGCLQCVRLPHQSHTNLDAHSTRLPAVARSSWTGRPACFG